jgi:acid phosphatase
MRKRLIVITVVLFLINLSWAGGSDKRRIIAEGRPEAAKSVQAQSGGEEFQPSQARLVSADERVANLGALKQLLKKYYACSCDCGCYSKDIEQQSARAIEFLRQRVAATGTSPHWAVVLDVDDTALSNYSYYSNSDFGYVPAQFDSFVARADAPPILPTLNIFKAASELGIPVFFISGRREDQRTATEQNLLAAGYKGWRGLILRGPADLAKSADDFKAAGRLKIVSEGFRLLLNVGDQMSDFSGDPTAELSVKLPNPMYLIP